MITRAWILLFLLALSCLGQWGEYPIPLGKPVSDRQAGLVAEVFRVTPYLQRPTSTSMVVVWFSHMPGSGKLELKLPHGRTRHLHSSRTLATALRWAEGEELPALPMPWRHLVELDGLKAGTRYTYTVEQNHVRVSGEFTTAPAWNASVRLAVFADSETEPESTGKQVTWPEPGEETRKRRYLLDQTQGLAANLAAIKEAHPDLLVIAGDLVEVGYEQRDWEEFWRHFSGLAASIPIIPALGNHEYSGGPLGRGYEGHSPGVARYLTYFVLPDNGAENSAHHGRYYHLDYGPISLSVLDTNNGDDADPARDTNHYLTTTDAPDFNPGSPQADWLATQLSQAKDTVAWRFVVCHHMPWSSGYHGRLPDIDKLSGQPVRALLPLLHKHQVTAMLGGHDEMYEHSVLTHDSHELHLYDTGIAGDGLRGPHADASNPYRRFLAHTDSPEQWTNGILLKGGKNYGHLIIDANSTQLEITPRYLLPDGTVALYDDRLKLTR